MRLSERLRESSSRIWEAILSHPFVVELYRGDLPLEKFRFYAVQDYNYLIGLIRSLSIAAYRGDFKVTRLALSHAHLLASIEMGNYEKLLSRLGLSLEEVVGEEPAPTNRAYVDFMVSTCSVGSVLECLVALLPCYWSYRVIALHHRDKLESNRNELYREWASVYLSDEYGEGVEEYRGLVDELWEREGGSLERLEYIFRTASRYEYMFWDMAYRMESWPV